MAKDIDYVSPEKLVLIGLDTEDREEHPLYDERVFLPDDENLMKNIMVYGILQPIRVRKEGGRILVVDGRQRVKAARAAAKLQGEAGEVSVRVPTLEVKGADDKMVTGIMISTNEQRQADDALTRAFKAVRMLQQTGDMDAVCIAFGRTSVTINNWLKLAEARPEVHEALKAKKIATQAAIEIARLDRDQQLEQLEKLLRVADGTRVSESAAKKAVKEAKKKGAEEDALVGSDGVTDQTGDGLPPEVGAGGGGSSGAPKEKKPRKERESHAEKKAVQQGVKRGWLRKALDTRTAEGLPEDQRKVLRWFAWGESEKGDWFDDFMFDVSAELGEDPE